MDIIVSLGPDDLADVQRELEKKYTYETRKRVICDLNSISLLDFCSCLLRHLHARDIMTVSTYVRQLRLLCHIFDTVDVDSRGVISWSDFTSFCLRMGRVYLSPSYISFGSLYIQNPTHSGVLPIRSLFYDKHARLLYAIDIDTPTIRAFRDNGAYSSKFNPIKELERLKKVTVHSGRMNLSLAASRKLKSNTIEIAPIKVVLTCGCYVEKHQKIVLCVSDGNVIFCAEAEGNQHVIGFGQAEEVQVGICYCPATDLLITWPGDSSSNMFYVWHPLRMVLMYQVHRHESLILSSCEVTLRSETSGSTIQQIASSRVQLDFVASCSIDRKVLIWPIGKLSQGHDSMTRKLVPSSDGSSTAAIVELTGHKHAIRSLVFAKEHELLLGAGFDFDIYAWDPRTSRLQLRLSGHMASIYRLQFAHLPHERLISIDESGIIKVWNLGKGYGDTVVLQSVAVSAPALEVLKMEDFVAIHGGQELAILASNKIFRFSLSTDHAEDLRPLPGGLGYCERMGRMWLISRRSIFQGRLKDGITLRRLGFMDDDRYDAMKIELELLKLHLSSKLKSDHSEETGNNAQCFPDAVGAADAPNHSGGDQLHGNHFHDSHKVHQKQNHLPPSHHHHHHIHSAEGNLEGLLGPAFLDEEKAAEVRDEKELHALHAMVKEDVITAVTTDVIGKKIFLGTMDGHVMMFDSTSFGLLQHLGKPTTVFSKCSQKASYSQGSVASLVYCERDELLVAIYIWGAIKIFNGCHRVANALNEGPISLHAPLDQDFPGGGGGQPPYSPTIFRECDYSFDPSNDFSVVQAALSEKFNIICVALRCGVVRVFDYLTLRLTAVLQSPQIQGQSIENSAIVILQHLPVIITGDNVGYIHIFSISPLPLQWVYSFCPWNLFVDKVSEILDAQGRASGASVRVLVSVYYQNDKSSSALALDKRPTESIPTAVKEGSQSKQSTVRFSQESSKLASEMNNKTDKANTKKLHHVPPEILRHPFRFKSFSNDSTPTLAPSTGVNSGHNRQQVAFGSNTSQPVSALHIAIPADEANIKFSSNTPKSAPTTPGSAKSRSGKGFFRSASARSSKLNSMANPLSLADESALDTLQRTWVLVMGDDVGRIYQFDLTKLLAKAGLYGAVHFKEIDVGGACYQEVRTTKLYQGLPPSAVTILENQLRRPVGSHVTEYTRAVHGINSRDVVLLRKWSAFGGVAVRNICPVIDIRRRFYVGYGHHFDHVEASAPPPAIMTASDVGIVKAFTWEGGLLGEMADEPADAIPEIPKTLLKNRHSTKEKIWHSTSVAVTNRSTGDNGVEISNRAGIRVLVEPVSSSVMPSIVGGNLTHSPQNVNVEKYARDLCSGDQEQAQVLYASDSKEASLATQDAHDAALRKGDKKVESRTELKQMMVELFKTFEMDDEVDLDNIDLSPPIKTAAAWKLFDGVKSTAKPENDRLKFLDANATISSCHIERDYIGALTAWVLPRIDILEVQLKTTTKMLESKELDSLEPSKFTATTDDIVSASPEASTKLASVPTEIHEVAAPAFSVVPSSTMEASKSMDAPLLEMMEVGSKFEEKYFNSQFLDIHFTKERDFGDSMTHVPLDYGDAESIDPHEFHASILKVEKPPLFIDESEAVRERGANHLRMSTAFTEVWGSKVRFHNLEKELDNGVFNTFPDPDFALGKKRFGNSIQQKLSRRVTGIDFLVDRELKRYLDDHPDFLKKSKPAKQISKSMKVLVGDIPSRRSQPAEIEELDFNCPSRHHTVIAGDSAELDIPVIGSEFNRDSHPNHMDPRPNSHVKAFASHPKQITEHEERSAKINDIIHSFDGEYRANLHNVDSSTRLYRPQSAPTTRTQLMIQSASLVDNPSTRLSAVTDVFGSISPATSVSVVDPRDPITTTNIVETRISATVEKFRKMTESVVLDKPIASQPANRPRSAAAKPSHATSRVSSKKIELKDAVDGVIDIAERIEKHKLLEHIKHSEESKKASKKHQEQRNRYGPYGPKDFYAFVDLTERVVKLINAHSVQHHIKVSEFKLLKAPEVVYDGSDIQDTNYELLEKLFAEEKAKNSDVSNILEHMFVDDNFELAAEAVQSVLETFRGVQELLGKIERLPTHGLEAFYYKLDLIRVIFSEAYTQEQLRILTFSKATELMLYLFKRSVPKLADTHKTETRRMGVVHEDLIEPAPKDAKVIHSMLMEKLQTKKREAYANKIASGSESGFMTILVPNSATGLQGWKMPSLLVDEARSNFDKWAAHECGTIALHDLIDIVLSMVPLNALVNCKPLLCIGQRLSTNAGLSLHTEVDGNVFMSFLLVGLRVVLT